MTLVIIALVAVLPSALGFGGDEEYTVGVTDAAAVPVAQAAAARAGAFDADVTVRRLPAARAAAALEAGDVDAVLTAREIRGQEEPDDDAREPAADGEPRGARPPRRCARPASSRRRRAARSPRRRSRSRPSSRSTAPPRSAAASRSSPS